MSILRKNFDACLYSTLIALSVYVFYYALLPSEVEGLYFMPWDGFVFRGVENLINYNKLSSNSLEYIIGVPDLIYQTMFLKIIGDRPYFIRVAPIFISAWIISYFTYIKYLRINGVAKKILTSLLILILFTNVPYQWLINDGVMYSIAIQLTYLFYILIILAAFSAGKEYKDLLEIYFLSILLIFSMIWTLSLVVTMSLFVLLFIFPVLMQIISKDKNWKNYKPILFNACINILLIFCLLILFYLAITYNNYGIEYSVIEDSKDGLHGATYGSLWGGLYTQLSGLSDWTMYQSWHGRLFGNMNLNFESRIPQAYSVFLYFVSLLCVFKLRANKKIIFLLFFVFIGLFLSKGNQAPFGFIYVALINSFKFFQAIRTPDTKFGVYLFSANVIIAIYYINTKISKILYLSVLFFSLGYLWCVMPPILNGNTTNGTIDKATGEYSYRVNPHLEKDLNIAITEYESRNLSGVVFPGIGNYKMSDGMHGWREYLDIEHEGLLNYYQAKEGPYGDLILEGFCEPFFLWANIRSISYVVLRQPPGNSLEYENLLGCLSKSKDYFTRFKGEHVILFEAVAPLEVNNVISGNKMQEIRGRILWIRNALISVSVLIFINLIYFFYRNSKFSIQNNSKDCLQSP